MTVAPVTPDPVNETILLVPSVAFVTTVRIAAEDVTAVGKYVTSTVHVPANAKDAPVQVSAVLIKGKAETVALVIFKLTVPPVLVMVKVVALGVPTVTLPKA